MKIVCILLLVSIGYLCPAQTSSPQDLVGEFDQLIAAAFRENKPGGVVLVAQKGQVIYRKAFGMANMELQVPMKENMVFYIGSLTKQFTAIAILQLMEQGKLSVKDDMRKYLPDYPEQPNTITIEHLLTHTAGLPKSDTSKAPSFVPGTKWEYDNKNYSLLGRIIEKVSGQSYHDYLEQHIFTPAGMTSSCYCDNGQLIPNKPIGYKYGEGGVVLHDTITSVKGMFSSGAIQSTAGDMFRWNRALRNNVLVKKETFDKATTPYKLSTGETIQYGYGLYVEDVRGSRDIRHGGGVPGFISEADYLPEEDVYVIIMLNTYSKTPIGAFSRIMAGRVIGKPYRFKEVALDQRLMKTYPGVYINKFKEWIVITEDRNKLWFQRPGGMKYNIKASAPDNFYFDKDYLWVEFKRDASNKPVTLSFSKVGIGTNDWQRSNKPIPALLPTRLPDSLADQYAGTYRFEQGPVVTVTKESPALLIRVAGEDENAVFPQNEQEFFSPNSDLRIRFNQNASGQIDGITWYQGNKKKEAKRQP